MQTFPNLSLLLQQLAESPKSVAVTLILNTYFSLAEKKSPYLQKLVDNALLHVNQNGTSLHRKRNHFGLTLQQST